MPETYRFVRRNLSIHEWNSYDDDQKLIEATPNLQRASLKNALLFGGPLVRAALEHAPLSDYGSRPHVFVDTKVTLLMPGWIPAIPGWHTDGIPRGPEGDPFGTGNPSLAAQLREEERGRAPVFHHLILGNPCLTQFLNKPGNAMGIDFSLEHSEDSGLYKEMTQLLDQKPQDASVAQPGHWTTWDWWNVHRATPALQRGWRLLIRITEGYAPPLKEGFTRPQSQVYVEGPFGW